MCFTNQLDKNKKKEKSEEEQSGFVAWILV